MIADAVYHLDMPPTPNRLIPGWEPDPKVAAWSRAHHYGEPIFIADANLRAFKKSHDGKPAGLYIWEGEKHDVYIGISETDVTGRLRDHLRKYPDANAQCFRYYEHRGNGQELREIERQFVHDAIDSHFLAYNREYSSSIYGPSVFDEVISVDEQQTWFENPFRRNASETAIPHGFTDTERTRSEPTYAKMRTLVPPQHGAIVRAIALYLRTCVPYPYRTQHDWWELSCLPSYVQYRTGNVLARLNMEMLEMLTFIDAGLGQSIVSMSVDYKLLPTPDTEKRMDNLGAAMGGKLHPNGGASEEFLEWPTINRYIEAMCKSPQLRKAAARLALDRMRKGPVNDRYRNSHNFLLAADALDAMNR